MSHAIIEGESISPEIAILAEIKESEKKADEILERAKNEKDRIVHEARSNASKFLALKDEEIKKSREKKISEYRDRAKLLEEERLAEGRLSAKQIKSKSEKNTQKAVDFVLKKFEEMV